MAVQCISCDGGVTERSRRLDHGGDSTVADEVASGEECAFCKTSKLAESWQRRSAV